MTTGSSRAKASLAVCAMHECVETPHSMSRSAPSRRRISRRSVPKNALSRVLTISIALSVSSPGTKAACSVPGKANPWSSVDALERGEVDLLVGGLTADNPHGAKLSLTRPYATTVEHGETVEHVMAVRTGENAMLSELERYLDEEAP